MTITPGKALERALEASVLTEEERQDIRDLHSSALVLLAVELVTPPQSFEIDEGTADAALGFTDAEPDVPTPPDGAQLDRRLTATERAKRMP